MNITYTLLIILLAPLCSAVLIALFFRRSHKIAVLLSVGAAAVVLYQTAMILTSMNHLIPNSISKEWLTIGQFNISMGFYLNHLSALMLFVVSFVGFLIHIFSVGYMSDDKSRARFFGGLSIFMFSMLGIVLADNLIMLFIFWELVGFSSYMLIVHYFEKDSAAEASKKAFIVNRVGDFGFLIGIIWCYWNYGTVEFIKLEQILIGKPDMLITGIGLCIFCGVLGKSAQMPLHVWLPDAMEGPTPVSALIHAATMVAAGIFLLCRVFFIFTPDALTVISYIGAITALFAAITAISQSDIKRILAYSTLSQLGYMVAAFGLGTKMGLIYNADGFKTSLMLGVGAAMFHLTTHAFFKALMFLGSGSVIHACHHEQNIFKMGGLMKKMPITGLTFLVGVIAISGVPFLASGFFSKDVILYTTYETNILIFATLCITSVLTAVYMGRLFVITFLGKSNSDSADKAKESPLVMTLPLLILAVPSILFGYIIMFPNYFPNSLTALLNHHNLLEPHGSNHTLFIGLSALFSLGGLISAWIYYKPGASEDQLEKSFAGVHAFCASKLYFDELYNWYVAKIQQRFSDLLGFLDHIFISGLMVRGTAGIVGLFGFLVRASHVGSIHAYVYWFLAGVVVYWAFVMGWM